MATKTEMRDLASEISCAFSSCATWTLSPPRGQLTPVSFLVDGSVSENSEGVSSWRIFYDSKLSTVLLELWLDAKIIYARMSLCTRRGIWFGRCRDGHISLVPPILDENIWAVFSRPEKLLQDRARRAGGIKSKASTKPVIVPPPISSPVSPSVSPTISPPVTSPVSPPVSANGLRAQIDCSGAFLDVSVLTEDQTLRGDGSNAIAIVGCNRPDYFDRVVASIGANPESDEWPVFVFLDCPEKEDEIKFVEAQAEAALVTLPHAVIVRRPVNVGCGLNLIDARRQLFDGLGFDRVWVFEDDLVISPDYISLVRQLLEWGLEHYDNVGVAQGWNFAFLSDSERVRLARSAEITFDNWWGYCQTRDSWLAVRDILYRYEELFLGCAYANRPHKSIVEWLRMQLSLAESSPPNFERPCSDAAALLRHAKYWNAPPTGQDAASMFALRSAGFVRLATTVTRGTYIGARGIHMNEAWFARHGFSRCELSSHKGDRGGLGYFDFLDADSVEVESADGEIPGLAKFPGLRYVRLGSAGGPPVEEG